MDNLVSLDGLFFSRVFRIPDYQRGYSWETRQIREFLEDLEILEDNRYHYTGTVVLHQTHSGSTQKDAEGNSYRLVDIVDGQQRVTTIVLLLDGICRSLAGLSGSADTLSGGIKKKFIATQDMNGQPLFKLSLNEDTDHFFKKGVLAKQPGVETPQITSERRLAEAKQQITDYLRDNTRDADTAEEWLRSLHHKVTDLMRFTLYQAEDAAEVGVIFEVMNDRGKSLTDLEKVKNYLLYASNSLDTDNNLARDVNAAWSKILRRLMVADLISSADEDRLLRAHWLTYHDPQSRRWQGSRSVKDEFNLRKYKDREQRATLLDRLHTYTQGLRVSSLSFCDAYAPYRSDAFASFDVNSKTRAQVKEWSAKLGRVRVLVPFLPILLAVRERWPEEPNKYLEILKLCEIFAFRVYRLRGYRSDAGQATLFHIGHDVAHQRKDFEDTIASFKNNLEYWCGNKEFESLMSPENQHENQHISNAYSWRGLRYFLYEYETTLALEQGASPKVAWDDLPRDLEDTIEHILPQSIERQPYWRDRFGEPEHGRYLHDLGNLTLTRCNSSLGNKPFPEKRGEFGTDEYSYAGSSLYLERGLTHWQDWNPSAIEERRTRLLEWGKKRWWVDLSGAEDMEHEPHQDDEDEEGAY